MSSKKIRIVSGASKAKARANLTELCNTNEFLINQNARLLCKQRTAEARLYVACAVLAGVVVGLVALLITGGPGS